MDAVAVVPQDVHRVQVDVVQDVPVVVELHVRIHVVETAHQDALVDVLDVHLTAQDHVGQHVAVDVVAAVQAAVTVDAQEVVLVAVDLVQEIVQVDVVVDVLEIVQNAISAHHIVPVMVTVLHVPIAAGNVVMDLDMVKEV